MKIASSPHPIIRIIWFHVVCVLFLLQTIQKTTQTNLHQFFTLEVSAEYLPCTAVCWGLRGVQTGVVLALSHHCLRIPLKVLADVGLCK